MVFDLSQVTFKDSEPGVINKPSTGPGAGGVVVVVSARVVVVSTRVVLVSARVVVVSVRVVVVSARVVDGEVEVSSELEQLATKSMKNTTVNKFFILAY